MEHEIYMKAALELAKEAAEAGEVPVGCVIVRDNVIIGRGRNRREEQQAAASHAEMEAIAEANAHLGSWRLDGCTLYVTLEPCPMCAGAIVLSRIKCLVYGAADPRAGACGTLYNIVQDSRLNHRCEVIKGVLAQESANLLWDYFKKRRQNSSAP